MNDYQLLRNYPAPWSSDLSKIIVVTP